MTAMKKTLYHIGMLAAAALAFAACTKEAEINEPKEEVTHVATISLGKADVSTKTEVTEGETSASYKWLDDDAQYLHVYENGTAGTVKNFSLNADNTVATLTVEFTGNPTAPYTYTAKYAKTLSESSKNPLILNEQKPGTSSFDPAADVLVSKATDDVTNLSERATEFTFTMGRVVTVNKMTLTGLEAGEVISSVEFTLDKHMAGYVSYSAENNSYSYSNGGTKLTLKYTATNGVVPAKGQFPVYFVSAPVDAAGIVSVVVTTDKNVYTKANTLNPNPFDGKTISFAIGTMKRFTMAMNGYGEEISDGTVYTLVQSEDDLYDGATYLIYGNGYVLGEQKTNNRGAVAVTDNSGKIIIDNTIDAYPVIIESVANGYAILDIRNSGYLYNDKDDKNYLKNKSTQDEYTTWSISITNGVAHIDNHNTSVRGKMGYNPNNGSPIFAAYTTIPNGGTANLALYIDKTTCVEPEESGLAYNISSPIEVAWDDKDSFVKPTLSNPNSLTVTYSSSDEAVATVDENTGDITFVGNGTTTITASSVKTSMFKAGVAEYQITVTGAPAAKGTAENPYTVAEVRASIDDGNTDACYIEGKISSVQYYYDATHETATYFISDDGLTTSDQFEAYSVKFLENKQWAVGNSQIAVGDAVVIYAGGLTIFQETTYETSAKSGSYLYSLNGVTSEAIPSITKTDISGISADGISNATATITFANADGWDVAVTPDGTIVTAASISGTTITYSVSANDGNARTGSITVTLTKNGRTDVSATINVSQEANSSSTVTPHTSTLTFAAKCNGSGIADDDAEWTVTSDGAESNFDSDRGIHYGTNNKAVTYIKLTTSDIPGTITKVVVNAAAASNATVSVTVDGSAFGGEAKSLTSTAADYTFNGSASGEIVVTVTKPSSALKALYVKSIVVTYEN